MSLIVPHLLTSLPFCLHEYSEKKQSNYVHH